MMRATQMQNEIATEPRDVEHRRRVTTVKQPSPPPSPPEAIARIRLELIRCTTLYTYTSRVRETQLITPSNVLQTKLDLIYR